MCAIDHILHWVLLLLGTTTNLAVNFAPHFFQGPAEHFAEGQFATLICKHIVKLYFLKQPHLEVGLIRESIDSLKANTFVLNTDKSVGQVVRL